MPDEKFKRNIAYKLRIGSILIKKPVIENERFGFLELGNLKVRRVNVIASVVEKYESEGEKKCVFVKIDDGSGQISLKLFADDAEKLKELSLGDTIIIIGSLRYFNDEVYISPEIIKKQDPKYLLLRKLETEKQENNISTIKKDSLEQNQNFSIKNKAIEIIKKSEENGGIEIAGISPKINEANEKVSKEVLKLIEEGLVFEPRPGIVRWLG